MDCEIINGEALDEMTRLIRRGVKVGLCLTDPPQGIMAAKWDKVIPLKPMWTRLKRLVPPERAIVLFTNEPYGSLAVASNPQMFRHEWVWHKNRASNFLNPKNEPLKEHEDIKVFSQKSVYYISTKEGGYPPVKYARRKANCSNLYRFHKEAINNAGDTTRYPRTVLEFDCVDNCSPERFHENQKPVALLEYLIQRYSDEGDTVLDFTAGSFSAGVAAINTKRNFIGIEQDAHLCAVGEAWMKRARGIPCDIPKRAGANRKEPLFEKAGAV